MDPDQAKAATVTWSPELPGLCPSAGGRNSHSPTELGSLLGAPRGPGAAPRPSPGLNVDVIFEVVTPSRACESGRKTAGTPTQKSFLPSWGHGLPPLSLGLCERSGAPWQATGAFPEDPHGHRDLRLNTEALRRPHRKGRVTGELRISPGCAPSEPPSAQLVRFQFLAWVLTHHPLGRRVPECGLQAGTRGGRGGELLR